MTQDKRSLRLWDVLIAWRDHVIKKNIFKDTKAGYLCQVATLIKEKIIDLEQPIKEFILEDHIEKIDNSLWSKYTKRQRISVLKALYTFAKKHRIKATSITIPFIELRDLNKLAITELFSVNEDKSNSQFLTGDNIGRFLGELCILNPRDSLICWMMWELKASINNVLDLKINDIDFYSGNIRLKDGWRISAAGVRQDLWNCILEQSKGKSEHDLLFTTSNNVRIHPGQLVRNMKRVSKRMSFPFSLSPKILFTSALVYSKQVYENMPTDERERNLSILLEKQKELFREY